MPITGTSRKWLRASTVHFYKTTNASLDERAPHGCGNCVRRDDSASQLASADCADLPSKSAFRTSSQAFHIPTSRSSNLPSLTSGEAIFFEFASVQFAGFAPDLKESSYER
jgi:hypothetical protein